MTKDMLERAKVCGKWLKYLRNDLNIWEMSKMSGKWLTYMVVALSI